MTLLSSNTNQGRRFKHSDRRIYTNLSKCFLIKVCLKSENYPFSGAKSLQPPVSIKSINKQSETIIRTQTQGERNRVCVTVMWWRFEDDWCDDWVITCSFLICQHEWNNRSDVIWIIKQVFFFFLIRQASLFSCICACCEDHNLTLNWLSWSPRSSDLWITLYIY